jgi:FdhD protein
VTSTPQPPLAASAVRTTVQRVSGAAATPAIDLLAVEAPLEISLGYGPIDQRQTHTLAVTMRTPGHDAELVAGFLLSEGIVHQPADIIGIAHHADPRRPKERGNVIRAELAHDVVLELGRLERHFYTTSSCGVCGKTSIDAVRATACPTPPLADSPQVSAAIIHALPQRQRVAQAVFEQTGGLHATALFSLEGELLLVREDVGRHNAFDKVVGASLLAGQFPLQQQLVLVSGRASFELVQKAAMAGVAILAAVGAPSSLAVEAAEEFGLTLLGFVRQDRFNIYSHEARITGLSE